MDGHAVHLWRVHLQHHPESAFRGNCPAASPMCLKCRQSTFEACQHNMQLIMTATVRQHAVLTGTASQTFMVVHGLGGGPQLSLRCSWFGNLLEF